MAKEYAGNTNTAKKHEFEFDAISRCRFAWDVISGVVVHDGSFSKLPYTKGKWARILKLNDYDERHIEYWDKKDPKDVTTVCLYDGDDSSYMEFTRGKKAWEYDPDVPAPRFVKEAMVALTIGCLLTQANLDDT